MKVFINELIKNLTPFVEMGDWNSRVFTGALDTGNALISTKLEDNHTPYKRWVIHQRFNRLFSELRAKELGKEAEVILGFFYPGRAEELSLFSNSAEEVRERFTVGHNDIIIGRGCRDIKADIKTEWSFNTFQSQDWGWKDYLGEHVEYYDAQERVYYRESMSGRTCYKLKIDNKRDGNRFQVFPIDIYMDSLDYSLNELLVTF